MLSKLLDHRLSHLPVKEQVARAFLFETDFLLMQKFVSLYKIIIHSLLLLLFLLLLLLLRHQGPGPMPQMHRSL
jgi:hypothetical protein